jgi:hypothetical protein
MKALCPCPRNRCALAACLLVIALLGAGCATSTVVTSGRTHPTTASRMDEIKTTAVLPPDITLNSLGAGGVAERRDDWTEMARANARQVLESVRPERIVYVRDLDTRAELADEIAEVQALFELIDMNLLLSYSPLQVVPPSARGSLDYSVGSIDRILDAAQADALLVVRGVDDIFATDRKALAVAGFILAAAAGTSFNMSSGEAHLSAALIGRDGTILWYDWVGDAGMGDLRKPEGVRATIERLLRSMPGGTGGTAQERK